MKSGLFDASWVGFCEGFCSGRKPLLRRRFTPQHCFDPVLTPVNLRDIRTKVMMIAQTLLVFDVANQRLA
jgi:hypothetical protein